MSLDKHTADLVYRTCKTFVSHKARHGGARGVRLQFAIGYIHVRYNPGGLGLPLVVRLEQVYEKYEGIAAFREAYGLEEAKDIW